MLLGFDAFATQPFSASGNDGNVTVTAEKNRLVITIGPVGQEVSSVSQTSGADNLILGTGSVTLSGNANVDLTTIGKNPLVLGTGTVTVSGNAVVDSGLGNQLIISSGTVTITGNANVTADKVPLVLTTKESGVITWNEIIPGATMVWTPIEPY
jgi:hypothetical protein